MQAACAKARTLAFVAAFALLATGATSATFASGALGAHLGLRHSTPSDGAHLAAAARELRLTFTEAIDVAVTRLRLFGPADAEVPISPLSHPGDSADVIAATVNGPLDAGAYRIEWQVVGRDGHPVRGTITYVIAPGAAGLDDPAPAARGTLGGSLDSAAAAGDETSHHDPRSMPSGGSFGVESPGYVAVRSLQFMSLLTVIGALTFGLVVLAIVARSRDVAVVANTTTTNGTIATTAGTADVVRAMRARAATLGAWAAGVLLLTALLRLYAQSLAMHGASDALELNLVTTMVTRTGWGSGWILEVAGATLAIIGFLIARRERSAGWAIAAGAGLALAITPALSGHAAATPGLALAAIVADTLHVIGASGWIGSLLFVLVVGIPVALRLDAERRGPTVARLVNAFSPTALVFASILVLTGLFAGWLHIGLSSALWTSDYGQMLLRKLVVLAAVIALGAWNWLRVKPTLGTEAAAHRLKRSATTELALAVVIVIITAMLVATPPPSDDAHDTHDPVAADVGVPEKPGSTPTTRPPKGPDSISPVTSLGSGGTHRIVDPRAAYSRSSRTPTFATRPSSGPQTSVVRRPPAPLTGSTSGSQRVWR